MIPKTAAISKAKAQAPPVIKDQTAKTPVFTFFLHKTSWNILLLTFCICDLLNPDRGIMASLVRALALRDRYQAVRVTRGGVSTPTKP